MVNLRDSVLWIGDWVTAAMHDPDFWMMRVFSLQLLRVKVSRHHKEIEISLDWDGFGRFRLGCPSDWNEWGPTPGIDYLYYNPGAAIDYYKSPF